MSARLAWEIEIDPNAEPADEPQELKIARMSNAMTFPFEQRPSTRVDEAAQLAIAALRGLALERAVKGSRSHKKRQRETFLRSALDILRLDDVPHRGGSRVVSLARLGSVRVVGTWNEATRSRVAPPSESARVSRLGAAGRPSLTGRARWQPPCRRGHSGAPICERGEAQRHGIGCPEGGRFDYNGVDRE